VFQIEEIGHHNDNTEMINPVRILIDCGNRTIWSFLELYTKFFQLYKKVIPSGQKNGVFKVYNSCIWWHRKAILISKWLLH